MKRIPVKSAEIAVAVVVGTAAFVYGFRRFALRTGDFIEDHGVQADEPA